MVTRPSPARPPAPGGPTPTWPERFLADPWAALAELADQARAAAPGWGLRLLTVATPLTIGVVAARWGWRRWRHQRLTAGPGWSRSCPHPRSSRPPPRPCGPTWPDCCACAAPWIPGPMSASSSPGPPAGSPSACGSRATVAPRLVERAVEAAWPGARTTTTTTRPTTPPHQPLLGWCWSGGELRLAAGPWPPLRTEHWVDPLRAVLGAAGELADGETATVQVLARPAAGRRLARATRAAHALAGTPSARASLVGGMLDLLTPGGRRGPRRPAGPADPQAALAARAALAETQRAVLGGPGPLWRQRPRRPPGAPASPRPRPGGSLRGLQRPQPAVAPAAVAAHPDPGRPPPAAQLTCWPRGSWPPWPTSPSTRPCPAWPGPAPAPSQPPPGLPEHGKPLGDPDLGPARPVRLTAADACHHVHLLGATGSGKSTLIANLALHDIHRGPRGRRHRPQRRPRHRPPRPPPRAGRWTGWCCSTPTSGPPHPP